MRSNSDWQNRLGTIRSVALGVVLVVIGVIWYVPALAEFGCQVSDFGPCA